MIEISPQQHIYTHVEKSQSPLREKGFQTLLYSHQGLSADDVRLLERRAFYEVNEDTPVRKQSYPLDSNRWVVGQMLPLPEPDALGRGGRYLVHNLILSAEEWRKIDHNPFHVFAANPFFTRVEEALEKMDQIPGNISSMALQVDLIDESRALDELSSGWKIEALSTLGGLGLRAKDLLASGKTLALQIPREQLLSVLHLAILLAPRSARQNCSFDTYFHKCDPARTPVWIAGFQTIPGSEFMPIKASPLDVSNVYPFQAKTPFEQWWSSCIEHKTWEELVYNQDLALDMEQVLYNSAHHLEKERILRTDSKRLAFFSAVNKSSLEKKIFEKLSATLSPFLATMLLPFYMADTNATWKIILNTPDPSQMAEWSYQAFLRQTKIPDDQLLILGRLTTQTQHKGLRFLLAFWQRAKDISAWRAQLESISMDEYRFYLQELSSLPEFSPYEWWSDKKANLWMAFFGPSLIKEDTVRLAKHLITVQNGEILELLAEPIRALSIADQHTIKKILQQYPELAPGLWKQLSLLPEKPTGWDILKQILPRVGKGQ